VAESSWETVLVTHAAPLGKRTEPVMTGCLSPSDVERMHGQRISLDASARPVVACPSTSVCGKIPSPAAPFLQLLVPGD
jgi:hypothetical protein